MIVSSKPGPKSNPHSRFIPREEIDEVAAWHFSAIGGSDEPAPSNEEVDAAPAAPMYDEQAMHEAREQAYAEGYAEGHEAGGQEVREAHEEVMRQQAEETAGRMGQLLHNVTDQLLSSEQKIARQLLELACELARQVVRQELKTNTRHLRPVIGEALEMMIDDGLPATVHMHPDDLAAMQSALMETLGESAPEFVADPTLSPGGCVVRSPSTTVDATIEKRWTRAVGNLGLDMVWEAEAEMKAEAEMNAEPKAEVEVEVEADDAGNA